MKSSTRPDVPSDHADRGFASLAEVKAKLSAYVNEVKGTHNRVTITQHGQPAAVLISVDELDSFEATVEELVDPDFWADWTVAQANIDAGRVSTVDEVWEEIERRRPEITRPG